MWLFERTSEERDPHQGSPFYHVTQISYLPVPVPWTVYPHFHEADYELTFITRGRFFLNLPGCTIPLQAGSVVSILLIVFSATMIGTPHIMPSGSPVQRNG